MLCEAHQPIRSCTKHTDKQIRRETEALRHKKRHSHREIQKIYTGKGTFVYLKNPLAKPVREKMTADASTSECGRKTDMVFARLNIVTSAITTRS